VDVGRPRWSRSYAAVVYPLQSENRSYRPGEQVVAAADWRVPGLDRTRRCRQATRVAPTSAEQGGGPKKCALRWKHAGCDLLYAADYVSGLALPAGVKQGQHIAPGLIEHLEIDEEEVLVGRRYLEMTCPCTNRGFQGRVRGRIPQQALMRCH